MKAHKKLIAVFDIDDATNELKSIRINGFIDEDKTHSDK